MRLGVISDIHGNLPALKKVLPELGDVDRLICLGDIAGYNPYLGECLELVQDTCDLVLQGNHDRLETQGLNQQAVTGIRYAKKNLSEEQKQHLQSLPEKKDVFDTDYLSVHSHPERVDEYVMPRDFPRMRPYLDDYRGIFLGHTHDQHVAVIDDRLILNPGSVGQPRDGDPRAAYAIVDTEPGEYSFGRVEYDVDKVVEKIEDSGLPPGLGQRLWEGR